MTLPGVEVRPLVTITGEKEFNEIFFTDVRVPVDEHARPGERRLARRDDDARVRARHRRQAAPRHPREDPAAHRRPRSTTPLGDGRTATDDPVLRQQLARVYLEGELLKLISDRAISAELHGRAMGPEGSIAKLLWSETEQHVTEVAADVLGPDALDGPWARDRVYSRALTIAGGTTQVNKNIVAQRILGPAPADCELAVALAVARRQRLARREREVARDELAGRDLADLPAPPPRTCPAPSGSGCGTGSRSAARPATGSRRRPAARSSGRTFGIGHRDRGEQRRGVRVRGLLVERRRARRPRRSCRGTSRRRGRSRSSRPRGRAR